MMIPQPGETWWDSCDESLFFVLESKKRKHQKIRLKIIWNNIVIKITYNEDSEFADKLKRIYVLQQKNSTTQRDMAEL